MDKNKVDIDDTNISLDLSDATQAVKENRFQDAILPVSYTHLTLPTTGIV